MKPSLATSLVAEGTSLSGDFSFLEEFLVAGTVNGSVNCSGDEHGVVKILDGGSLIGEITPRPSKYLARSRPLLRHHKESYLGQMRISQEQCSIATFQLALEL